MASFGRVDDDDEEENINADINDAEHAKATRKSQRSRRSVDSEVMITDEGASRRPPPQAKQPKAAAAAAATALALEEEIAARTLYDCQEHTAFMEGHARYGNQWKKISVTPSKSGVTP